MSHDLLVQMAYCGPHETALSRQSWKTSAQVTDPRHETQAQGRAHSKRLSVRRKMTAVD